MEPDFSGFVSKANLKCADGRTIMQGAFKHQDGLKVPLVYQHNHDDLNQVLGYAVLKEKDGSTWGDAYLNGTPTAQNARTLIEHGDLDKFSIWAKNLQERGLDVLHGDIQEVSLVLAGANPGASVSNVLMHAGLDEDDTLMIVGFELKHADTKDEPKEEPKEPEKSTEPPKPQTVSPENEPEATPDPDKGEEGDSTVADVLGTLNDSQRTAVNSVIDDIVTEAVTEALTEEPALTHSDTNSSKKGRNMSRNVFDRQKQGNELGGNTGPELKHADIAAVISKAKGPNGFGGDGATGSLRELIRSDSGRELMHAADYGVENIEVLFPDAQALMRTPTFVDRRQEWVKTFMNGTSKSPFSRVKTVYADITADEARAKGYIKAGQKTEEVFPVFKRTTGPAMVYKKQKLDRQDIIDITDFDVVAWMKAEMRGKLDEEIARAALFGDGRPTMVGGELNPDKIPDPGANNTSGDGIRAILNDNDLYTGTFNVPFPATPTNDNWNALIDEVTTAREFYMGSGNITAFMSYRTASKLLTIRDNFGHRIYKNLTEVAGDLDVSSIVRCPTELFDTTTLLVLLDLGDYNFGTNRGGEVTLFDDFDIDFNQYKYLIETYLSGALTLPYSAQVFKSVASTGTKLAPTKPAYTPNIITIPTQTGVVYKRTDTGATLTQGSTLGLDSTLPEVTIEATPAAGYYFEDNLDEHDSWDFEWDSSLG